MLRRYPLRRNPNAGGRCGPPPDWGERRGHPPAYGGCVPDLDPHPDAQQQLDLQDRLDSRRALLISLVACVAVVLASMLIVVSELCR